MNLSLPRWITAVAVAGMFASPAAAQDAAGLRLDLNIPALQLTVYDGNEVVKRYPVAVGKPGFDTPTGSFTMDHAEWNPWWRPPPGREWTRGKEITPPGPNNPMGRVKLFFAPLYFIHGTPEAESIGSPASHGCVRMRNSDVVELARLLHERAAPNVTQRDIDRILAASRTTRTVRFQRPLAVTIRYEPVVVDEGMLKIHPDLYRYNRVHGEGVIQALLAAGYRVDGIDRKAVQSVIERASRSKATIAVSVDEVLPNASLAAGNAAG